jgi:hypothetical protein
MGAVRRSMIATFAGRAALCDGWPPGPGIVGLAVGMILLALEFFDLTLANAH